MIEITENQWRNTKIIAISIFTALMLYIVINFKPASFSGQKIYDQNQAK